MSRHPLSSVDAAWLRMEDPTNLMMVTGVLIFDAPMDWARLKSTLEHRLLCFDRFRQRVVQPKLPLDRLYWEDDPRFDLSNHLKRITLPPPGGRSALQKVANKLMSTPLDFSRPLWQLCLVERYGQGSAIIARLHHCIADGIALVHVLLSLTDTSPDAPWSTAQPKGTLRRGENLLEPILRVTETLVQEGFDTLIHPSHALDLVQLGTDSAAALGRLVLRWPDPITIFKGPLGVDKRATWSEPLALKDVKTVGHVLDGTVNDVLLTAVTGALRDYMRGRGADVDGLNLRAIVPVNLRPLDVTPDLGNRFSLVFLSLPVGIADPVARLRELKRRMDDIKGSKEAAAAFGILNTIGMVPQQIQDIVVDIFGTKGTAVMTNVPGPKEKLYLAGAPLDTIMFWVPQSGHLGLGVSIISYAGQVRLGIATDAGLVPDPDTITTAFHTEFDQLVKSARKVQAARGKAVKPMMTMLDHAIEILDTLLEKQVAQPNAAAPSGCHAKTRSGQPCKSHPLPGSIFCRVHQKRRATKARATR